MLKRHWISILGTAFLTGLLACGKEEKKPEASTPESAMVEAAAAEAQRMDSMLSDLVTEQELLEQKVKAAGDRLEKQGNKTRKKLKPGLASLEAERARVAGSLEGLKSLADPAFTEAADAIRAQQDSLSKALERLEKSMK